MGKRYERNYNMPDKKMSVISQLMSAFQKKKHSGDDIVKAADKVIEDYICLKNRLIKKACSAERKKSGVIVPFAIIALAGTLTALLFLL